MAKNSAAKIAANNRYTAKAYDRINFVVPKGQRDIIRQHAESRGESVNAFILRAVEQTMRQDNHPYILDGDTPPLVWREIEEEKDAE